MITIRGADQIMSRIRSLPDETRKQIYEDVGEYGLTVIREYPKQRSVSRAQAYPNAPAGPGWFSDKQRKYVMAKIRRGDIKVPYSRTQTLANSWKATATKDDLVFSNMQKYAPYVMGNAAQSNHEKLVGWKKIVDIIDGKLSFKSSKFRDVVMSATQSAIRKLKLG